MMLQCCKCRLWGTCGWSDGVVVVIGGSDGDSVGNGVGDDDDDTLQFADDFGFSL